MNTENVLFEIFNEMILLYELYEKLSPEQAGNNIENVVEVFSQLPPNVLNRYRVFLASAIKREEERGAIERASVLEDLSSTFLLEN